MDCEQAVTRDVLEILAVWLSEHEPAFERRGLTVKVTWGPRDRTPASALVDFESTRRSARLVLWSNGLADLSVGDDITKEILLDEHREITSEVGLDDVEATVLQLFQGSG
jgi:hypothetical protein